MTEKELNKLIKELRRKDSKLLPNQELFIRVILAQRLEDEKDVFIDHPFFTDEDEVLELPYYINPSTIMLAHFKEYCEILSR